MPNITLRFRTDLLAGDAIMVSDPLMNALARNDPISGWGAGAQIDELIAAGTVSSPLQIELNGNASHSGTWIPVNPIAKCQPEHYDYLWPNRSTCQVRESSFDQPSDRRSSRALWTLRRWTGTVGR